MRIELITVGSELLLGFTIDTNAAFIARELGAFGIEIVRRTTVGDTASEIAAAVRDALERNDGVITTGGLGPTSDDLTKPAIADLFGREMRLHEPTLQALKRHWRERGRTGDLPPSNVQQAMIPDGATILANHHGTAPGIWIEDARGRWVAMLPGVPREMREMLGRELLPKLRDRVAAASVIRSRTLRTTGIAESQIPDRLGELANGIPPLSLAYLPDPEGVDLRLTARGLDPDEADRALAEGMTRLRGRLGILVYGEERADLADVVLQLARRRGLRLAVAESCTGGLLGGRITRIPGASDVFAGGIVAYDDVVKRELLGVPSTELQMFGAVSEAVARSMAEGVRTRLAVDVGLAITGVAGPGGGTEQKPVGTVWMATATPHAIETRGARFVGDREEVRRRAVQATLDMLRRALG